MKKQSTAPKSRPLREMTITQIEAARQAYNRSHPNDRIMSYGEYVSRAEREGCVLT